ncbi:adenosylcobinamide-GDP ribazoletransferase [Tellurirhabdus bombi]|uniref:adenosylcobinamide-GDP ribazoletransferase n=1 Tax=Tellurirhabdus bombi TaxID=2907205 RepID=UPI001F247980|nr:adenosylcobinamide-GDP ribazoletransferase [Tellurirhabdus bombi]
MKHEIRLFFTALQFYTRLPVPAWVGFSETALNQATRYFPLIGWLVALAAGLVWLAGSYLIDNATGLILAMVASIGITGAFHEDGFADVCDGFGGGWTKEKILEIMKDSRIGAYGVVGLILLLGLKFTLLHHLSRFFEPMGFTLLLITAHSLSRFIAATFLFTHPYARTTADSKARAATQGGTVRTLCIAAGFALVPLLGLAYSLEKPLLLLVVLPLYGLKVYLGRYFTKWIGGYTGDCLGATQQLTEVGFYFLMGVLWKFT